MHKHDRLESEFNYHRFGSEQQIDRSANVEHRTLSTLPGGRALTDTTPEMGVGMSF